MTTNATSQARRLAALLLCITAVSSTVGPAGAGSSDATERLEPARVKSGTGFFVSSDGFLVTSAHVVSGCRSVSVWQQDGARRPSYVIAFDRVRDVALLWADGSTRGGETTVARMSLRPGEEVYTLGYGVVAKDPLNPVLVEGWLVGNRIAERGVRIVVFRGALHAGHSGGAVLANDGALVGMVVGRDKEHPELGVAIPREDIEALLTPYGIRLPKSGPATNAPQRLAAISVLIQCSGDTDPPQGNRRRVSTGASEQPIATGR